MNQRESDVGIEEYRAFIASKAPPSLARGSKAANVTPHAKEHQRVVIEFALNMGSSAVFCDCVSGDTMIETITGPRRIDDLEAAGKPITVLSRDKSGKAQWSLATTPFKKGRGHMRQITLDDGSVIRATSGHRFLTPEGWIACGDVATGQILECAASPHRSTSGTDPLVLRPDALRYSGKSEGLTDGCFPYRRQYGQPLPGAEDTGQAFAPSLAYALALDGCRLPSDDRAHKSGSSPSRRSFARPSMQDSSYPALSIADAAECPPLSFGSRLFAESIDILRQFLSAERRATSWREHLQCLFQQTLGGPACEFSFVSRSVVSIHESGEEVKYDMHVPGDECYLGNGIWCHNTGLGKSLIEIDFARQVAEETGKPSLILTPLAVAGQMVREGQKFGIDVRKIREQSEVGAGVMVANYERLPKLDPSAFGAIVLDESGILKSFGGKTSSALCNAFRETRFKLAATATPAPNDHMEIGQHSDFLNVMPGPEMLSRWFIADQKRMGAYRLKGHAVESFWQWVASWSRCATLPSDLGGDDTGYVLPEVIRKVHQVRADRSQNTQDMLFRIPEMSATSFHAEKRLTLQQRCEKAAELANHDKPVTVWCETNEESAILSRMIDGAIEVHGALDVDEKERRLLGFADGQYRAMVTKPKLAGFGVNWQHCAHAVFASISFSYEQHYQAVRRSHRFGQSETVRNDIVISDTEAQVWQIVQRKSSDHDTMKRAMATAMRGAQSFAGLRMAYGDREKMKMPHWLKGA